MKKLREKFGFLRIHEIVSFEIIDGIHVANINILREGIDGSYTIDIPETVYGYNDKTIQYIAGLPEYAEYEIV